MVSVRGLHKWFGPLHVLKDIDLTVAAGEVVVVVGPSGSGKSTLCRCLNRLETAGQGSIEIDGEPLPAEGRALARLRADVGMVFQSFNLFAPQDGAGQRHPRPHPGPQDRRRPRPTAGAMTLLERVGIADKANNHPAQLSGGQQQRAAIARALAMQPKVMLFDEPTSALDPEMVNEVLDVMVVPRRRGDDHDRGHPRDGLRPPRRRPGRLHGRRPIVESGAPDDFFAAPRTERARDFLSKILQH